MSTTMSQELREWTPITLKKCIATTLILALYTYCTLVYYGIYVWYFIKSTGTPIAIFLSLLPIPSLLLSVWAYLRTAYTHPGFSPHPDEWKEHPALAKLVVYPHTLRNYTVGMAQYCNKCRGPRPERSHHCSACRRCILRKDHHCSYLHNCVGLHNHRYYVQCIYWLKLTALIWTIVEGIVLVTHQDILTWDYSLAIMIQFMIVLLSFCYFTVALGKQVWLLLVNQTSQEAEYPDHNPYNINWKENLRHVMGPPGWAYIFPIANDRPPVRPQNDIDDLYTLFMNDYSISTVVQLKVEQEQGVPMLHLPRPQTLSGPNSHTADGPEP